MAAYPGIKPMLDFVHVPEVVEGRPRRRRCTIKTPKNPRVKAVPLDHESQQPFIKWISPQFNIVGAQTRVRRRPKAQRGVLKIKSSKRVVQPLELEEEDSPHISIYPSLAPHIVQSMSMQTVENEETSEQRTYSQIMDLSQTHVSQNNDQTVPDVTTADQTVPDVTTVEDAQHTMDDFPVEDLSALVGNMSLDDETDPLEQSSDVSNLLTSQSLKATTCCPHKEPELFQPPSTSTPCRDCSTLPLSTAPSTKPCEQSQFSNLNFVLQMTETTDDHSEDEQLDDYESDLDLILAVETPQHLWHSPEVKVIDNTFS